MLGRKQSIRVDIMAPDYVQEESLNENAEIDWVNKVNSQHSFKIIVYNYKIKMVFYRIVLICFKLWVRRLMRFCALLSLLCVSLNTPKTFVAFPFLQLSTFVCDFLVTGLYTAEMIAKMHSRGILKVFCFCFLNIPIFKYKLYNLSYL